LLRKHEFRRAALGSRKPSWRAGNFGTTQRITEGQFRAAQGKRVDRCCSAMKTAKRSGPGDPAKTEKLAMAAIEEARMVLPGIQALFGFQLIAAFNETFRQLEPLEQILHFVALIFVAVAIAIIMTPAAYHRLVERGSVSDFFVRLASWLVAAAMLPLMIALCIEVYLLGRVILHQEWICAAVAVFLLIVFSGLWFFFPFAMRLRRPEAGRAEEPGR
jgi:Family of unknown function (DUF6328)